MLVLWKMVLKDFLKTCDSMNKSFVHRSELWFRRDATMQWHCVCYRLSWRVDRGHNTGQIKVRVLNECHRCVADQHRAMPRVLSTLHLGRHNTTSGGNSLSQVCHKSLYFSQSGECAKYFLGSVRSSVLCSLMCVLSVRGFGPKLPRSSSCSRSLSSLSISVRSTSFCSF